MTKKCDMALREIGLERLVSLSFDGKDYTHKGFSERLLSPKVKEGMKEYLKTHGISDGDFFRAANMAQEYEDKNLAIHNPEISNDSGIGQPSKRRQPVRTKWQGMDVVVTAPFASQLVLDTAKQLVDDARPQFQGPYGGTGYSRIRRQRILDIVLWFFDSHKRFPVGDLGLDSNWVWRESNSLGTGGGYWFAWNGLGKTAKPCFWVHFNPVPDDVLAQCQNEWEYLS